MKEFHAIHVDPDYKCITKLLFFGKFDMSVMHVDPDYKCITKLLFFGKFDMSVSPTFDLQFHPNSNQHVRMAEWSKALRSGRSLVLQAWVRIPLLTKFIFRYFIEFIVVSNINSCFT